MKICTITCHDVYNYGASLQAFALQYYLECQGHDVKIIDYKPDYLSGHYKLWTVANNIYDKPILKHLYLLAKLPERLLALKRKEAFDKFTSQYLHLTRRYNSYEELKKDAPDADVYIAGSDQIWNTIFPNGRDKGFYLDFGNDVKRISYAASFATKDIVPEYREFVKNELQNLDACSIRERMSLSLLRTLVHVDAAAVCDPVFLHNKEGWLKVLKGYNSKLNLNYLSKDYILVYLTEQSKEIEKIVLDAKHSTGFEVYIVGNFRQKYADKNFIYIGPLDFLHLIYNAQFVVSNSFHATAFSIIFEKKFCVANRKEHINERMESLLEDLGLEERLTSQFYKKLLDNINYHKVNIQKDKIVQFSKNWLYKSLLI